MAVTSNHDLSTCSVVREEHDQGVVPLRGVLFNEIEDSSDVRIHRIDHRCMDRHFVGLKLSLKLSEGVPRNRAIDFAGPEFF